jgi:hypothetical protein
VTPARRMLTTRLPIIDRKTAGLEQAGFSNGYSP